MNHAEVLVLYKKKDNDVQLVMYDPTNASIKTVDINQKISERKPLDLRFNIRDVYSHLNTEQDKINFIERYGKIAATVEHSKRVGIPREDLELLLKYAEIQCTKNKDKIEDFYSKNKTWYSIIANQKSNYYKSMKKEDKQNR